MAFNVHEAIAKEYDKYPGYHFETMDLGYIIEGLQYFSLSEKKRRLTRIKEERIEEYRDKELFVKLQDIAERYVSECEKEAQGVA